jgi:carboxypeptidase D
MHGDEVVGRELMLYLSRYLAENYAGDTRIRNLLDHSRVRIIPSMNPDGFEKEQRHNADDIDLNRDFPDFTSDDRDTPKGRAIETQAVMALHAKHPFVLAANFHGGEVCFNMPWDTKDNFRQSERFGDDPLMVRMARKYADANRTMRANSGGSFERGVTYGYEWYEVDGGMQDWSIHYRASTHGTVELSYAKWPPASQLPRFWDENRESMISYLENGLYGFHLRIVSAEGEPVAKPTVKIASLGRDLTYATHHLHRTALPGAQTVRISAPGYAPFEKTLEPSNFDGSYQTIVLQR